MRVVKWMMRCYHLVDARVPPPSLYLTKETEEAVGSAEDTELLFL